MNKTLTIGGLVAVTTNENNRVMNLQFMPDDELTPVFEQSCSTHGKLQLMRNGSFDFTANPKRYRVNSTLLRKAAHGRISATRDEAFQLTLKIFKREGLDVKETLEREAFELINHVKL